MPHRVVVLALDGVMPMDLGIASRVLDEALDPTGARLYSVTTCSLGGRPVRTNGGFRIIVDNDESLLESADTVVIATQEPEEHLLATGQLPGEVAAALARIRPLTRIVSLCTSAFLLAAGGLLDGLRATTHWALCGQFARLFPDVEVDPDVLFVDNGRILTAAGGAAGIDLFLHLVRRDHGATVAGAAARRCVVAPWREGGQAQFIEHPVPKDVDRSTSATRQWALNRLTEPVTLKEMARHAHMSERTFTRRFRAEVGTSPLQWLVQSRLSQARRLLESSDLTVERIATACGFGDPVALRKHFHTHLGLSPLAYRRVHCAPEPIRAEPAAT
ncbi:MULTISPECIES: helix-turn-helix domain-containing protein [unclassified Streptomyces]|uniref:GlxA family transcriptional regulator n=1 Tax=unclassified Streptomyces TaxID=2593676 RepID=UPI002DDC3695|nr:MULTISPECIES: helix-turn-helix domain-containing protein [unclassified Streptomyces]WSA95830.1 helix-turn-helix domain-containing protein [Streptomyces sp. NBC_01795]WSS11543.1 helix-turn-helix domain-containing protein [Streptomyces sp. NBC_01186]WSS40258.1 helix-turn-helix domain-containing protein [Streptomyces sp. NBC_01187]